MNDREPPGKQPEEDRNLEQRETGLSETPSGQDARDDSSARTVFPFDELLEKLLCESLNDEEASHLLSRIKSDEAARASYMQHALVHAGLFWIHGRAKHSADGRSVDPIVVARMLREEGLNALCPTPPEGESGRRAALGSTSSNPAMRSVLIAAGAVAALVLLLLPLRPAREAPEMASSPPPEAAPGARSSTTDTPPIPSAPKPLATLVESVEATWTEGGDPISEPQFIEGSYYLSDGLAKLRCNSGAEIVIEGPAGFSLETSSQLFLHNGKVVVLCPTERSRGFVVGTTSFRVTDLGTEFGVQSPSEGNALLQVFDGSVQLKASAGDETATASKELSSGQATQVNPMTGMARPVEAKPLTFIRDAEFTVRVRAKEGSEVDRWRQQTYALRRDPSLVAYYRFGEDSKQAGVLLNQAINTLGQFDGQVVRAAWSVGRFPEKPALDFAVQQDDREGKAQYVVLDDSQEGLMNFQGRSFSVGVWLRFPRKIASTPHNLSLPINYMGLVTKGNDNWRLQWFIPNRTLAWDINHGPDVRVSTQVDIADGDWHFVVATLEADLNAGAEAHRLYVDGELRDSRNLKRERTTNDDPVMIGGNSAHPELLFDGAIDEVMVFGRAITDAEVRAIYGLEYSAF